MSLAEWQTLRHYPPRHLFDQIIDRSELSLPDEYVPLSRGVAVASDVFLSNAGYYPALIRPPGWQPGGEDCFWLRTGSDRNLVVRRFGPMWSIERWGAVLLARLPAEVLVSTCGSLPVVSQFIAASMRLAEYCHENCPPGVRWVNATAEDTEAAVAFARAREKYEAAARRALH
jgi:hypothetical protein